MATMEKTPALPFNQPVVEKGGLPSLFTILLIRTLNTIIKRSGGETWSAIPLPSYTVLTLPTTGIETPSLAYCSNETGGAVPVFFDGTNWRRVTDRAIAS